jgi:hypothetical protein
MASPSVFKNLRAFTAARVVLFVRAIVPDRCPTNSMASFGIPAPIYSKSGHPWPHFSIFPTF